MRKINITDITLKELSKDRAVSLLFREKTAVATCADSLGIDAVELAGVKNEREDKIIYKTICQNVKESAVAIPIARYSFAAIWPNSLISSGSKVATIPIDVGHMEMSPPAPALYSAFAGAPLCLGSVELLHGIPCPRPSTYA